MTMRFRFRFAKIIKTLFRQLFYLLSTKKFSSYNSKTSVCQRLIFLFFPQKNRSPFLITAHLPMSSPSESNPSIADLRVNYQKGSLDFADVQPNPLDQFSRWFDEALRSELPEPNALHLSTLDASTGRLSGRIVLLKGLDTTGFVFYTNYNSRKGREISHHAQAAMTFLWAELERQVRIEGRLERVSAEESDAYFASRPRASQLGAWVSEQSTIIGDRAVLEQKLAELELLYLNRAIPRPAHWGGYRLVPDYVEFWQGRPSRLHDRLAYTQQPDGAWRIERLSP
jgi:pyridoxamine 5'-phosphate oxidase